MEIYLKKNHLNKKKVKKILESPKCALSGKIRFLLIHENSGGSVRCGSNNFVSPIKRPYLYGLSLAPVVVALLAHPFLSVVIFG